MLSSLPSSTTPIKLSDRSAHLPARPTKKPRDVIPLMVDALKSLRRDPPPFGRVGIVLRAGISSPLGRKELAGYLLREPYPRQLDGIRALISVKDTTVPPKIPSQTLRFLKNEGAGLAHHLLSIKPGLVRMLAPEPEQSTELLRQHQRCATQFLRVMNLIPRDLIGPRNETIDNRLSRAPLYASMSLEDRGGTMPALVTSVRSIHLLEEQAPGAAATITKRFGIRVFGRYPVEYLVHLGKAAETLDQRPVIVWVNPATDHNGGCYAPHLVTRLHQRATALGLQLVCLEASSAPDLTFRLDSILAQWPRLTALVLSAHSCGEELIFGEGYQSASRLSASDASEFLKTRFSEGQLKRLAVVLDGCCTGDPYGLAHELSRLIPSSIGGVLGESALLGVALRKVGEAAELRLKFSHGAQLYRSGLALETGCRMPLSLTA
jgi:hypothetical protein